ncbi:MAG: c-type cytochrome, partial [Anaerolineales bacterium]
TAQSVQPGQVATSNSAGVPPAPPASEQLQPPATSPDLDSGMAVYLDKCIQCHGPQAMGDGEMASSLESPPPALADPEIARLSAPADWYTVVTLGRMEKFMPPFSSLTDQERWDVTGFLLSIGLAGEDSEAGQSLFEANCAECHLGDNPVGGSLVDSALLAEFSRQDLFDVIEAGLDGMPGFGGDLSPDEIWALAAYVQQSNITSQAQAPQATSAEPMVESSPAVEPAGTETLDQPAEGTLSAEPTGEVEPTQEPTQESAAPTENVLSAIAGQVVQGTSGADLPTGLIAQLIGIEENAIVVDRETPISPDGEFRFEDLEAVPGRVYAVVVEYQGVPYFSDGTHLVSDEPVTDLTVVIHETTTSPDQLLIQRVHLIADPSATGQVIITELWVVVNIGDRTIFDPAGGASMQVTLPEGYSDLEFFDESAQQRYRLTDNGFDYTGSLVPGFETEVVFSFTLDFDNQLDYEQVVDYPVGAVVALIPEGSLTISGDAVTDRGVQDMGGTPLHTYDLPAIEAGQAIEFRLRATGSAGDETAFSGLVIGLAVLGVGLMTAGVLWYRQSRATEDDEQPQEPVDLSAERDQLLRQMAELDDAFESGDVNQASYEKQRAKLKEQVRRLMQDDE